MKKWGLILFYFLPFVLKAQIITTIAGGGIGADGSPATTSVIYDPNKLIFDAYGNLYFSENLSDVVRKIDTFGIIHTVAGTAGIHGFSGDGGSATEAILNQPNGLAFDRFGNLYIADEQNNRVRKIDAITGIISTVAGSSSTPGFSGDGGMASSAKLFTPSSLCFDKSGNLYVGDGNRIREINSSGIINTIAGNGFAGNSGDGGPATAAECFANDMCVDDSNNLYIAEYGGFEVRKISKAGIITTIAGDSTAYLYNGDEIPATNANMAPAYIAFNSEGELLISDVNNDRIRMIDVTGVVHTIIGTGIGGYSGDSGPANVAEINYPSGLVFDQCDNLYLGQVNTPRIRKVTYNVTPCTYLSVNNVEQGQFLSIYPNPTYDLLNINNLKTPTTYNLQNIIGATIQHGTLKAGNNSISLRSIPNGMYMLELIDEEGNKKVSKIVKQ